MSANCPHCKKALTRKQAATIWNSQTHPNKAAASRRNGAKGGRPKKRVDEVAVTA